MTIHITGCLEKIMTSDNSDNRHSACMPLPCGEYRCVVADPPWPYRSSDLKATPNHRPNTWNGPTGGVAAKSRYGLMSIGDLKRLAIPVADDSHLYLWTTNSFMVEAHEIAEAWGFKPKTILTWVKTKADGTPSMKMGYWFRGATEHVLFCVRGKLRLKTSDANPTAYMWPRLKRHSEKPQEFFELVERVSPGPYLEMFARTVRPNWTAWGNEVSSA